jgi:tetratricopeptide (TPR) repeat protein
MMRDLRVGAAALAMFLCAATAGGRASAAEAPGQDQARALFASGTDLYDRGEFLEAARDFEHAYELDPLPDLLFNIGAAYDRGGDFAAAVRFYRRFAAATKDAHEARLANKRADVLQAKLDEIVGIRAWSPSAARASSRPLHRRWWLWTIVGGAAGVAALGVGLGVGLHRPGFSTVPDLGPGARPTASF